VRAASASQLCQRYMSRHGGASCAMQASRCAPSQGGQAPGLSLPGYGHKRPARGSRSMWPLRSRMGLVQAVKMLYYGTREALLTLGYLR
jgi:hypothetical protein